MLAIALAVIDGPNLIERIFNIDAGIQSGFKTAMAAVGIGRMAAGAMHGISHGISGVGKGIGRFADSHRTTPTAKDRRSANAMANKKKEGTMLLSNGEFTPNIHS